MMEYIYIYTYILYIDDTNWNNRCPDNCNCDACLSACETDTD